MSQSPKTLEEAKRLQEVTNLLSGAFFLGSGKVEGDTIIQFVDDDGELKHVTCIRRSPEGPDEWVKVPV